MKELILLRFTNITKITEIFNLFVSRDYFLNNPFKTEAVII